MAVLRSLRRRGGGRDHSSVHFDTICSLNGHKVRQEQTLCYRQCANLSLNCISSEDIRHAGSIVLRGLKTLPEVLSASGICFGYAESKAMRILENEQRYSNRFHYFTYM